jgi:hypothetical protein
MKYLRGTRTLPLILSTNGTGILKWWVDAAFAVHPNMRGHSGGGLSLGRGFPIVSDKICMMMTRLACNRAIESSYWRMDNNSDVGLLTGYVLYRLPLELEFMDLDTFSR